MLQAELIIVDPLFNMEEDSDGTEKSFQITNKDKSTLKKVKIASAKGKRDNAIQGIYFGC